MSAFVLPPVEKVIDTGAEPGFVAMSDWLPAATVREVKSLLKVRDNIHDQASIRPAFQTAQTNPDHPDAATGFGTALTTEGQDCSGVIDISMSLAGKFFVRFGVIAKSDSTESWRRADVTFILSARD